MRVSLLLALLLLTTCALAERIERLPQRLVTSISADVTVGADGQLQSIGELSPKLDPELQALVLAEMRAVEFSPGRVDGRPVVVQTSLSLTLGLRDGAQPGEFLLELVDVGTGPNFVSRRAPQYPPAMLQRGREAKVMTHLRYDADGRVVDAEIISSSVPVNQVKGWVLAAAHKWRFEPERADGIGLAGEAFVPVRFTLDRPIPKYLVRLNSGTRLEFAAEQTQDERDEFASALELEFDAGRVLDIGGSQAGS